MDLLRRTSGLACIEGDRSACRGACEHEAGEHLGSVWPRCPIAEIDGDAHLQAVLAARTHAKLSPLAGFPEAYSAGAMRTWLEIDEALRERFADADVKED